MKKSFSLVLTTSFFKDISENDLKRSHITHSKCAKSKELVQVLQRLTAPMLNLRNAIRTSALMSLYILISIIKSTWASLFGTWVSLYPLFLCGDSIVSAGLLIVVWDQLNLVSDPQLYLSLASSLLLTWEPRTAPAGWCSLSFSMGIRNSQNTRFQQEAFFFITQCSCEREFWRSDRGSKLSHRSSTG